MSRKGTWTMTPEEALDLGVSLADRLDDAELLIGTPTVTLHTRSGSDYTQISGALYTVASPSVNVATFTDQRGHTVAIGKGVLFRLTAPATQGTYYVLIECAGDDGTAAKAWRTLTVEGPLAS